MTLSWWNHRDKKNKTKQNIHEIQYMDKSQAPFQSDYPMELMNAYLTTGHASLTSAFAIKLYLLQTEQ